MDQHHTDASTEITFHHEPAQGTKRIWKTFWLLLVITVIELGLGLAMYLGHESIGTGLVLFLKGVIVILSLAKAFYIVSIFMHLGDELRNMIMTIIVPLMLFVWFIGAFLWDGNAMRTIRNRYDKALENKTVQPAVDKSDTTNRGLN